ncbi:MAG: NAD(P)H:quinone oxidoreductase, partial [Bacillota bacterium]
NYKLAKAAEEGAREAGAEVRVRKVHELAPESVINGNPGWKANSEATKNVTEASTEDLEWADVHIFSAPTRYGNMASQMKQFLDTTGGLWAQGKLANKVATAMTSAQNPHGGQEMTLWTFYYMMAHWGAIIVTPGYTDRVVFEAGGNPYGTSVTTPDGSVGEKELAAARHQARRAVEVAQWVIAGREAREGAFARS